MRFDWLYSPGVGLLLLFFTVVPAKSTPPMDSDTPTVDRIVVAREEFRLRAYDDDELLVSYPVAVGTDTGPTPLGTFRVVNKLKNPWYTPDDEPAQRPGPDNPLGTRWIGIDKPHYGLHGTRNPTTIGTRASEGCVRLLNRHVETLFPMVQKGTTVIIKRRFKDQITRRSPTSSHRDSS